MTEERYECYENYNEYRNGWVDIKTDNEEWAFEYKRQNRKSVVYDNVTDTFLE